MKIKRIFSALVTVAATGCATIATDTAIVKRTGFALGLDASEFTISDRQNAGTSGTESSDAICNEIGGNGTGGTCNALLKKASKC